MVTGRLLECFLHEVSVGLQSSASMLVNLVHPAFEPKVECDVVSTDGYSVNNLISSNLRERNQGFLAAHFIRPPVLLLFQLPFPSSVETLVLKPKVGSQISTGIDIFVARSARKPQEKHAVSQFGKEGSRSFKVPKSKRQKLRTGTGTQTATADDTHVCNESSNSAVPSKKPALHEYLDAITVATFKGEHMHLFTQVGRIFGQDGRTICVVDPRFQGGRDNIPAGSQLEKFRQVHLLRCVTHFALRITRVNGSCAAAIGKVELWGKAAPSCGREVVEYACQIHRGLCGESNKNLPTSLNRGTVRQNRSTPSEASGHEAAKIDHSHQSSLETKEAVSHIPEEFIDAITCNIMTIPMLLPSGHNVDSTTLDKHFTAEQMWGRAPSDPFTGILFSETHKAVPNSALKVRIDKFLLSSGLNVQESARTVGRAVEIPAACSLQRVCVNASMEDGLYGCNDTRSVKTPGSLVQKASLCMNSNLLGSTKVQPVVAAHEREYSEKDHKVGSDLHHEDKVSQSLDMALQKTLQGLSTFTRKQPTLPHHAAVYVSTLLGEPQDSGPAPVSVRSSLSTVQSAHRIVGTPNKTPSACVCCRRSLADGTTFRLPCQHLICRKCLMAKSSLSAGRTCDRCGESFSRTGVVRVHHM